MFQARIKLSTVVTVALLLGCQMLFGQTVRKGNSIAGPEFSLMKYSISFADQAQVSYDGSDLSKSGFIKFMPPSIAEAGDVDYYVGHYGSAAVAYYNVVASLPIIDSNKGAFSLYKVAMNLVDYKNLTEDEVRLYTGAINVAGMLYHTRGKFVYADSMLNRALKVRGDRLGKISREYVNSLCNVAVLNKDIGNYESAEKMFDYLERTIPKLYGKNSIQYVTVINNKAMLLAELGRTKAAIALLDEALSIGRDVLSEDYFDYERILTNRALIEQESGRMEEAKKLYQQVLTNLERKEYEDHPDYNNVLVYYGALRIAMEEDGVYEFLEESSAKVKKRYGNQHLLYAKAISNLGEYHLVRNSYEEAKMHFQSAADIQLSILGPHHKDYLGSVMKVAICNWSLNKLPEAASGFNKAIESYLFLLKAFFPTMSESEKTKFWGSLKPNLDTYFAFSVSAGQSDPAILRDAYDVHLKTKGILFSSTSQTRQAILASADTTTAEIYGQWLQLKTTLANYYSSPLEDIAEDKIDLAALELEANALEKKLSQLSLSFQSTYVREDPSYNAVRDALQEGEAAVEVLRIAYLYGPNKGKTEYAGLIARHSAEVPTLVLIRDGVSLEKRSLAYYKNSIQTRIPEETSYTSFWGPFDSALAGLKKVYVSVDGVYNSINLNTLRNSDGEYLIEKENIVLVPSTRFVSDAGHTNTRLTSDGLAALVGSPNFGQGKVIDPLPGTKVEIEKIESLLVSEQVKTKVMTEDQASEENLKSIVAPDVLHIATHGYFLSDVSTGTGMTMGVNISRAKENPLLRSGLLLTGAEATLTEEPTLGGANNGILNAYEVMNLNLQDTKLVILSACETGTGEIVNGEGVYGLSRAFQIAGAQKIIMSLWKVDDEATQELMSTFYRSWIETKNAQDAFLTAQRTVKEKYQDPYYWGAFVLLN